MQEITIIDEQCKKYYSYLDDLRESGVTNMFGATPFLQKAFSIKQDIARQVLSDWMFSYSSRYPID